MIDQKQAKCACLRVIHGIDTHPGGLKSEHWRCVDCLTEFVRKTRCPGKCTVKDCHNQCRSTNQGTAGLEHRCEIHDVVDARNPEHKDKALKILGTMLGLKSDFFSHDLMQVADAGLTGDPIPSYEDLEVRWKARNESSLARQEENKKTAEQKLWDLAAYILDRADQYPTKDPCWIALADVAENIVTGEAANAASHGELDASLYRRLETMKRAALAPARPFRCTVCKERKSREETCGHDGICKLCAPKNCIWCIGEGKT